MKIFLICPEVKKMSMATESANRYVTRAKKIIPTELKEFRAEKEGPPAYKIQKEEERILKKIAQNDVVVALDEKGKDFSTKDFSRNIERLQKTISGNLVFIVGGPYGLGHKVKERANLKIKLSSFTFNSEIAIVVLCEQVYRMLTVISGHPYHNE